MSKVYATDMLVCITAYIRADSAEEALARFKDLHHDMIELREQSFYDNVEIGAPMFDKMEPGILSISPAATIYAGLEVTHDESPLTLDSLEEMDE